MEDSFNAFLMLGILAAIAMYCIYQMQKYKDRCDILDKVFGKKNCDAEVKNYYIKQNEYYVKTDQELRREGL